MSNESWVGEIERKNRIHKETVKLLGEQIKTLDQQREELLKVCEMLDKISIDRDELPNWGERNAFCIAQDKARELLKTIYQHFEKQAVIGEKK